jgi:hypothetical protein
MKAREIYKNGRNWAVVITDNDGTYLTTFVSKTKTFATKVFNQPYKYINNN